MRTRAFRDFFKVWRRIFDTKETREACIVDVVYVFVATVLLLGIGVVGMYGVETASGYVWGCSAGLMMFGALGSLVCAIGVVEKWYDFKDVEDWKKFDD